MQAIHISPLSVTDTDITTNVCRLFNSYAESELPYKKMSLKAWSDLFLNNTDTLRKIVWTAVSDNQIIGFAAGCHNIATDAFYITFILVAGEYRRKGIGRQLLCELERSTDIRPQITFFNPCALTWLIPNTDGHDHPNAPGVDISSDAFSFFKCMGYVPFVYQNSFHLTLEDYRQPSFIADKKEKLMTQGISLTYYNPFVHYGLAELCDDLGNPVWKEELLANDAAGANALPLMAAIHDRQIIGFTGPLRVQESGRGYFAGIGVHSRYRGLGLGTILFHTLCASLKSIGAEYMTLFTGTENPAGEIYQNAGFQVVKTWADMEKNL